jgi:hypothetical protein
MDRLLAKCSNLSIFDLNLSSKFREKILENSSLRYGFIGFSDRLGIVVNYLKSGSSSLDSS